MPDYFDQMAQLMSMGMNPVTRQPPSTEDYVRFYRNSAYNSFDQFRNILMMRRALDRAAAMTNTPRDMNLRNAEHAYVTDAGIHEGSTAATDPKMADAYPVIGGVPYAAAVPVYSLTKLLGQKSGLGYTDSTPPSWEEVKWGLAPYWGGIPKPD